MTGTEIQQTEQHFNSAHNRAEAAQHLIEDVQSILMSANGDKSKAVAEIKQLNKDLNLSAKGFPKDFSIVGAKGNELILQDYHKKKQLLVMDDHGKTQFSGDSKDAIDYVARTTGGRGTEQQSPQNDLQSDSSFTPEFLASLEQRGLADKALSERLDQSRQDALANHDKISWFGFVGRNLWNTVLHGGVETDVLPDGGRYTSHVFDENDAYTDGKGNTVTTCSMTYLPKGNMVEGEDVKSSSLSDGATVEWNGAYGRATITVRNHDTLILDADGNEYARLGAQWFTKSQGKPWMEK